MTPLDFHQVSILCGSVATGATFVQCVLCTKHNSWKWAMSVFLASLIWLTLGIGLLILGDDPYVLFYSGITPVLCGFEIVILRLTHRISELEYLTA